MSFKVRGHTVGRGMPVFMGARRRQIGSGNIYSGVVRRQIGGNIFGFLRRMLVPLARQLFTTAKPHLKTLGRKVGKEALRVGSEAMGDLISGNLREIPNTIKREGKAGINRLSKDYVGQEVFNEQEGSGRRSRKRKAVHHRQTRSPPAKRRRRVAKKKKTKKSRKKKHHRQKRSAVYRDIFSR